MAAYKYGFFLAIFCIATLSYATPISKQSKIAVIIGREKITLEDIAVVNANDVFQYNIHNDKSGIAAKANVNKIENLLSTKVDLQLYSKKDIASRAHLFYKLGSYYIHDAHNPDAAISNMLMADNYLKDEIVKFSNYNNLALAYAAKYEHTHNTTDKERSIRFSNRVIHHYQNMPNQQVAFAYCVKGKLLAIETKQKEAQVFFDQAFAIYKKTNKDTEVHVKTYGALDTTFDSANQVFPPRYNYCQIVPSFAATYCNEQLN